jgi:hypothetical protein
MTSNAQRGATLVRALHAGARGDREVLATLFTDDVRAWTPALAATSLDELLGELSLRDGAFSDIELEVFPLEVGGDYACAEWRLRMVHDGELSVDRGLTLPPSGLQVTINGATVAEFDGDLICALRQYWDELALYEQLGLVGGDGPSPGRGGEPG